MKILQDYPLKKLNSFGIAVNSRFFVEVGSKEALKTMLNSKVAQENPLLILGGGSNILFTKDYPGMVILNQIKGIEIIEESEDNVLVSANCGEVWQDLVEFCIAHNFGGIENLSLIPGSVGAAPIQNIGAYGVELKEVLVSVGVIDLTSGEERIFSNAECKFGYRDSIFKNEFKDRYFIHQVKLRLAKKPELNTSYGALNSMLEAKRIENPTIKDISEAVIEIRRSKLPDPSLLGNAGSFFKNPVVDKIDYEGLKLAFPNIPGYINGEQVKIPAAWLIEQCGWKGKRLGAIGVHEKQPLVLVNYGGGTGEQIKYLADDIKKSVARKFGLELEVEPRII